MRPTLDQATQIVANLSQEQKIRLVSGRDFWTTEPIDSEGSAQGGVPSIMLTDGPHGLRKQAGDADHVGLADSVPATCFPTASALGATWDVDLLDRIGRALGRECRAEDVGVLLGPGLNIKRHPAGGRAFEYFSEDPHLSGTMAAALVRGIQSQSVGACLKHFAANNQETNRLIIDTIVDERTLRELYLTGFELAVKESEPWTVMTAYNQLNGTHCGENPRLLTDILRDEWGFDGLLVTDWLATYDRVAALNAGLDLEMPGSQGTWDDEIATALDTGDLEVAALDRAAMHVVDLALRASEPGAPTSRDDATSPELAGGYASAHHDLARTAAAAGTVLLTNNGMLPLSGSEHATPPATVAVIGAFATEPRYQGSGSSLVQPTHLETLLEELTALAAASGSTGAATDVTYAAGYDPATGETTDALISEAVSVAAAADAVVLVAGLPGRMESEGYDREHLRMPAGHERLIEAVTEASDATAVVLMNGAPIEMPWIDRPAAVVEAYLGGQAGGGAVADILWGVAEPGGRLAESFPVQMSDLPADAHFPGSSTQVEYREGMYVGYRFHDAADVAPLFPFGHGLSYTTFDYSDLMVRKKGQTRTVSLTVTNTGQRVGSDVVQVYVRDIAASVERPVKELKGYRKVRLQPGEATTVTISLDRRAFAFYDVDTADWAVEPGQFEVLVGASSADIRLRGTLTVKPDDAMVTPHTVVTPDAPDATDAAVASDARARDAEPGPAADSTTSPPWAPTDAEFAQMLGGSLPEPRALLPYHRDSTVSHLQQTATGRLMHRTVMRQVSKLFGAAGDDADPMMMAVIQHMPLRGVAMASSGGMSLKQLDTVIRVLNVTSVKAWRGSRRSPTGT